MRSDMCRVAYTRPHPPSEDMRQTLPQADLQGQRWRTVDQRRVSGGPKEVAALGGAVVGAVIRAKDKADTIREAIASVQSQTLPVEVIVVDSGSRDGTPHIAREMGAHVLSIPAETFTSGSAINIGVAETTAEFALIISAHCSLPDSRWLERALLHFGDSRVAGVNGALIRPARVNRSLSAEQRLIVGAMNDIVVQDRPFDGAFVGFSNSCSLVRRSACDQFPFDETMTYAEDKDWANRVTQAGHRIVYDAALGHSQGHVKQEGYRSVYRRGYKAADALTELYGHPAWTLRKSVQHAVLLFNNRSGVPRMAFLHPATLADYAGRIAGARHAARHAHH